MVFLQCDWQMENSPQIRKKPEGLAKCHQTLSSWVGSGDETKKCIDLDHVELFHLIVWKLYHVIEYAKGFHISSNTTLNL